MSDPVEKYRKHDVVFFYDYNAKVFSIYGSPAPYLELPNVLVDPDYRSVEGRPPHHWCIKAGKLALLSDEEVAVREEWHKAHVQVNPNVITVVKEVPVDREVIREVKSPPEVFTEFVPIHHTEFRTPLLTWVTLALSLLLNFLLMGGIK